MDALARSFALATRKLGGKRVETLLPRRRGTVEPHIDLVQGAESTT
jgi:hypothetical protein